MRNVWLLCRVQLAGLFRLQGRRLPALLTLGLYILAGLMMMAYSAGITWALSLAGMGGLGITLMLTAASLVALGDAAVRCGGTLLACRDYDFVASLPVSAAQHVGGRLLAMYLTELCFFAALTLPAAAVYAWEAGPAALIPALVTLPLAPLIPLALGIAAGALILLVSARARHAQLWAIFLGIGATIAVLALAMALPGMGEEGLLRLGGAAQYAMARYYPPARALERALCGDWRAMAAFAAAALGLSALTVLALARAFGAIHARLSGRWADKRFLLGDMPRRAPLAALYRREIKRLFSLPVYAINTLIGPILYIFAGAAAWIMGAARITRLLSLAQIDLYALPMLPLVGAMAVTLAPASSCAESLEGKARWILKSAPVSPRADRAAKLLASLTVLWPGALLGGAMMALGLGATGGWAALMILLPAAWALPGVACGLAANLKWPRYDWVNETQVVKQGLPLLIAMLFTMLSVLGAGALTFCWIDRAALVLWVCAAAAALGGGAWCLWLCRK